MVGATRWSISVQRRVGTAAVAMDLEGDQNPWKDRMSMPGNGKSTSRTRRWSNALKLAALALEQSRRLRSGQHSSSWGYNRVESGHSIKLRLAANPKETDAVKPGDPVAQVTDGRSKSRSAPERGWGAATTNPGLVHIDSPPRWANRDGTFGLQIDSLASRLAGRGDASGEDQGNNVGFGWCWTPTR